MCGTLSDKRSSLWFSVVAGHYQSLSQDWVPQDSWAYFIVSIFYTNPNLEGQVPVLIFPRKRVAQFRTIIIPSIL
jgi:hypothetical protein